MGDGARFNEKWDFRRQENNFDDSSSDDPDSNSINDPLIHNLNPVLDSNQSNDGTNTVTREEPAKTRKKRSKKDENKPKQVRRRKPKTVCVEENEKKDEEMVMEKDDVGMFMKTLLDELTASRESLMDWVKAELYGSDQNGASQAPLKKRAVVAVAAHRTLKKRRTKKKVEEEEKENEKESKMDKNGEEMNKAKDKNSEIVQNGRGDQVQELDCNAGPLDRFLMSGQGSLGRNYFHQQQQGQEGIVLAKAEKNATVRNQKSVVLAIQAPNLRQRQKKTRETKTIKNISSMVERTGSGTQKDDDFAIPIAQKLLSTPSLQRFPVTSSLNSLFPSSSQGITSFASNNTFQLRQPPVVTHIPDLSEFQTGFTEGFGNSMFHNNGYFSGFPAAFQPNLISGGYNFQAQVNPTTSSQQRDNNNMFGGLRMVGGAIRYSGERNSNSSLSDYRTGSGR